MKFRTDINFLRALSVLIVLFFHFEIPGFSGGFLGVDVFFVISGFLMTMIILRDFEKDHFTLKGFYERRIRRLIPALSLLLLFVLVISSVFFFKSDLRLNAKYVGLADIFFSNIYFWKYQNYFSSTDNILLHTWSLGVEWQFYLFYPIILLLLRKIYFRKKNIFWSILLALTLASFAIMLFIGGSATNFTFYMLPSRYWELSLGGLAYGLSIYWQPTKSIRIWIVALSILVIISSAFFITPSDLWPSTLTLLPVVATFLILSYNVEFSLFNNQVVRFFGNISYSLYLWHWPWYILFKYFGLIDWVSILVITLLSILSAYLSYKYIESNRKLSTTNFALGSALFVGTLALVLFLKPDLVQNVSIYKSDKYKIGNFKSEYLESGQKNAQFNSCGCFITDSQTVKDYNHGKCLIFSTSKKNILLMGDSHAAQFSASLRNLKEYNFLEASVGYTFPLINSRGQKGLVELNDYMYHSFIPANKEKIDLVLLSTHWLMRNNTHIKYTEDEILNKLKETILYFDQHHIKYLIIGQTETYKLDYAKILMLESFGRKPDQFINDEAKIINDEIQAVIPPSNFISIYNSSAIQRYESMKGIPYFFDNNHLTRFGADQIVEKVIAKRIKTILKQSN